MKSAFTSLFLLIPLWAFTQSCPDFERLMREGTQAKDYEMAFKKYDAADAVACTEALREQARTKKSELFKKINALREKAEKAETDAKNAAAQIEEEQQKTLEEKNKAIEALRLAQLLSDSVAQATSRVQKANESVALLIQINDLVELGDIASQKEDYHTAIQRYTEIAQMLDQTEQTDTFMIRKRELIRLRIASAREQKASLEKYRSLMARGDSLNNLGLNGLNEALKSYLEAGKLNFKKDSVLNRLATTELFLKKNWQSVSRFTDDQYLEIVAHSAAGLKFAGDKAAVNRRIFRMSTYPDMDVSRIYDPSIRQRIDRYQKSSLRKLTFYWGFRARFGQQSYEPIIRIKPKGNITTGIPGESEIPVRFVLYSDVKDNFDFGLQIQLNKRVGVGLGYNRRGNPVTHELQVNSFLSYDSVQSTYLLTVEKTYRLDEFYVKQVSHNFNFSITYDLFKVKLFRHSMLNVQLLTGMEWNDIFYNEIRYATIPIFSTYPSYSEGLSIQNQISDYYREASTEQYYYLGSSQVSFRETELMGGFRFKLSPLRRFNRIGLFADISYRYALSGLDRPNITFNIAQNMITNFEKFTTTVDEELDPAEVAEYIDFVKKWHDIDITISARRRQLLYAWNLNTGIYYRF